MSYRPFRDIKRRKTKVINVGDVKIGGENPISVQSMTNTVTTDIKSTIKQINAISEEGADIVRVSCPDQESTIALKEISKLNKPVVFIYTSDHGESPLTGQAHDSSRYIWEMSAVPFLIYFNEEAKLKYPDLFEKLNSRALQKNRELYQEWILQ